jgi:cell division protein FtsI/penicillin-binding protein 2
MFHESLQVMVSLLLDMNSSQQFRSRFILIGIGLGTLILGYVLFSVQILQGDTYAARAHTQYVKPGSTLLDRGSIFFTAKDGAELSAASLVTNYTVFMNPKLITDPEGSYQALSQYMDLDKAVFMEKATRISDPYEELSRRVEAVTAKSISDLSLSGIGVTKEIRRLYPNNELAAQTVGIIGENSAGSVEGRYGLEKAYQDVLVRTNEVRSVNIFAQIFTSVHDSVFTSASSRHGDVVSSIEPTIQAYLEKTINAIHTQWKSDEIGGIIMDPHTGEIVAMAAFPNFDPNNTGAVKNPIVFSNPLVENAYEMGSIMKPLTVALGIDSGAITPEWTYDDTGTLTLSGKKISNFDGKARGTVATQEILSQSLNVGAATVALKVGKDTFSEYFQNLGFGSKTGIDQPNESSGLTANLKTGLDIEIATMSFGQGISLSPIAMTRALAVLANDGNLVTPHVGTKIKYVDGSTEKIDWPAPIAVFKKESVADVTDMLVRVVDTALLKGALKNPKYSIAAKTGTAQIADPVTKGYYPDRYLHSFFGYFPASQPRFIVFLYQKYPKGAQYASETLAQPFGDITKFLIDYYNIAPDR